MSFVLDNSVALTWCFEDDRTPATTALLERVGEVGAVASAWPDEGPGVGPRHPQPGEILDQEDEADLTKWSEVIFFHDLVMNSDT